MKKRGQLTIFIIVGILLVASVSLFFLSRAGFIPQLLGGKPETSANVFLDSCLEEEVDEVIELILKHGGYTEGPFYTSFFFEGDGEPTNITYLCYNQNYYSPCVNQAPALFQTVKNEIKSYLSPSVRNCFDEMVLNFEGQGFDVSPKYTGFDVEFAPNRVTIQTDSEVTLTKSGESSTQKNFRITVSTRLYELLNVVQEIINKETFTCDFDHRGYQLFYPQFEIDKIQIAADSSDIYRIKYSGGNEEFLFAVRGCVIPPGL